MAFSFEDAELFSNGGISVLTSSIGNEALKFSSKGYADLDDILVASTAVDSTKLRLVQDEEEKENVEPDLKPSLADVSPHQCVHSEVKDGTDQICTESRLSSRESYGETAQAENHKALLAVADELCEQFDRAWFQESLHKLVSDECKRQRKPPNMRLGAVLGRMELALKVHAVVLPKYGFPGTRKGVIALQAALAPYSHDAQMSRRMAAIDDLLWMPQGATANDCEHYAKTLSAC